MHAVMGKLTVIVLCFFSYLSNTPLSAAATDALEVGHSMRDNETLISAESETFVLGFFSTGRANNRYLGIWYNRIPVRTVVWVANRQRPVPGSTGSLNLMRNGSLVLADAAGTVYWSTTPSPAVLGTPVARLLDDGNLVVLKALGKSYAWESFAHPSDSLLPGMNMGFNRWTGERLYLAAWRSVDDPAPGTYSAHLDARGVPQLFVMNGMTPVWRGGPWLGGRFAGIPGMKDNGVFNYGFIPGPDVVYVTYGVWNKSMLSRLVINRSGFLEHLLWDDATSSWAINWASANETCEKPGACGPNGLCVQSRNPVCGCLEGFEPKQQQDGQQGGTLAAPRGCVRKIPLDCRNGGDTFVVVRGSKLPDTAAATVDGAGFEDCRTRCLRSCSCTAFSSSPGSGCIAWFGELADVRTYSVGGQDLYVRLAAGGRGSPRKEEVMVIVTVSTTMLVLLLLMRATRRKLLAFWVNYHYQRKDAELPVFHFSTISSATNRFSHENKIGQGGFGTVYKGVLEGENVAVKRLSKDSIQGLEEFKSEIQLVAKLQHMNLVKLLGYCTGSEEKILIYEYMLNQSLDKFIFDPELGKQLDWRKRFQIINGIAQGLLYLHQYSRLKIIHRDLKASNILLDDEWNPKISDFGLAKIFTFNSSQANTNRIVGTYGYMSPEYVIHGRFSVKSDVFSFGVLLLEILSGKKSTDVHQFGHSLNLPGYAWDLWREGRQLELVDPTLYNTGPHSEMSRCVHVALLCVQHSPVDRPIMSDVVSMLDSEMIGLRDPNQPAFFLGRSLFGGHIQENASSNDVTMSELVGR